MAGIILGACTRFLLNPNDQPVLDTLIKQNAQFNLDETTALLGDIHGSAADGEGELGDIVGGTEKDLSRNILAKVEYLFEYSSTWDKFVLGVGLFFTIVHAASFPILALLFGRISNAYIVHTLEEQKNGTVHSHSKASSKDDIGLTGGLALSFLSKVTTTVGAGVNVSAIPVSNAVIGEGYFGNLNLYNARADTNEDFAKLVSEFSIYYVYIGLIVFVASFMQTFTWESVAENQLYRIRQKYIFQLQRQQLAWFEGRNSSSLVLKLADDCERFRVGVGHKFSIVVEYVAIAFFGAGIGFLTNAKLTFVFLASTPFIVSKILVLWVKIAQNSATAQRGYAWAGKIFSEVLLGISMVAANATQAIEEIRYKTALTKGSKAAEKVEVFAGLGIGGMYLLIYAFYAVALWYSVNLLAEGVISPNDIYTVFVGLSICAFAVGSLLPYLSCIADSFASKQLVTTVLNSVPDIDPYSMSGLCPRDFTGKIRFSNVTFAYPGCEQTTVFKNLDFDIPGRGTIGIVAGASGGKTTLVRLMQRFYDVQIGQVLFDKRDVTTLNVRWVRDQVSVVNKKAVLLNDTIFENIRSWRKDVPDHKVIEAAKLALVHDAITTYYSKGYMTKIGKDGACVPESERIKIHIARNIILNPKILILLKVLPILEMDDSKEILKNLAEIRKTSSTLIVDSKLNVMRESDFIFVLKDGTVVEQGTDEQLVEQKGIYYRMLVYQNLIPDIDELQFEVITICDPGRPDKPKEPSFMQNLGRLISAIPNKLPIYVGLTGCVLSSLMAPLLAICLGQILHMFVGRKDDLFPLGVYWVEMLTGLAVLAGIGYCSRTIFIGLTAEGLSVSIRRLAFKSLLRQHVNWFNSLENAPTRVQAQLTTNIPIIKNAIGPRFGVALSAILTTLMVLVVSACYNWKIACVASMIIPLMMGCYCWLQAVVQTDLANSTKLRDSLVELTSEIIRDVEEIQAISKASVICSQAERIIYPALIQGHKQAAVYALVYATTECFMFFIFGLTFRVGAELIREGTMSISSLLFVFFLLTFGSLSLGQATNFIPEWLKARHASEYIVKVIDLKPKVDNMGLCPCIIGQIEFWRDCYDFKTNSTFRKHYKIPPGTLVAIVGPSGSGKSNLLLILQRFSEPNKWQVLIDGVKIQDINPIYLRNHIGYVPQEPVIFDVSIRANIAYGYQGPEEDGPEKITNKFNAVYGYQGTEEDSLKKTQELYKLVEDFAENFEHTKFIKDDLPSKFMTRCGEQGRNLSFTQRQAVSLARAAIKKPTIYLLDDPSGSLDREREKVVDSFFIKGCTTLLVTDSYERIKRCGIVALLHDGNIKEFGKPSDLLKSKESALYKYLEGQGNKMD